MKLTPCKQLIRLGIFIKMTFKFAQHTFPLTSLLLMWTIHLIAIQYSLKMIVINQVKWLTTDRTWLSTLNTINASSTIAATTLAGGHSQPKKNTVTDRTLRLYFWWR
jgi:hypothetical protein